MASKPNWISTAPVNILAGVTRPAQCNPLCGRLVSLAGSEPWKIPSTPPCAAPHARPVTRPFSPPVQTPRSRLPLGFATCRTCLAHLARQRRPEGRSCELSPGVHARNEGWSLRHPPASGSCQARCSSCQHRQLVKTSRIVVSL